MRAIIFANGIFSDHKMASDLVQSADLIIAADGGARHCQALEIIPTYIIGDFDSLSRDNLAQFISAGSQIIQYPKQKDQTDLQLALEFAVDRGAKEIIVLGALGNRWDQTLGNILLTALPKMRDVRIIFLDGQQRIFPISGSATIEGQVGDTVSFIPLGGEARGVTLRGLEYSLTDGTLPFGSTLGISNALTSGKATVEVKQGLLLCIIIHAEDRSD